MGEAGCILQIRVLSGVLVPHWEDSTRMYNYQYQMMKWVLIVTHCKKKKNLLVLQASYIQCAKHYVQLTSYG